MCSDADNLILPDATSENDKKCSQININNYLTIKANTFDSFLAV